MARARADFALGSFGLRRGSGAALAGFFVVFGVWVLANASTGAAANDVATAIETAIDNAVRTAMPWITFSDENISVFISVLFWTGERVTPV